MKVNTSSSAGIVTFVIMGDVRAASTTVYGGLPPLMVSPHGWHVVSVSVKLGWTEARVETSGGVYRQDVSVPAI